MARPAHLTIKPFRRHDWIAFAAIVGLALVARGVFLTQARACPLMDYLVVDAKAYNDWAEQIAAGDWLGDKIFYQAPLYPYFLAVIKMLFGSQTMPIRIVQVMLGSITCGVLFLAGRVLVGLGAGIAAGVMLALYPPAIFYDAIIQKAGIGSFLMACLLLATAALVQKPAGWKFVAAGFAMGLLALTREETRLVGVVLAMWIVLRKPSPGRPGGWLRYASGAAFLSGLAIPLAIVAARNHAVGGEWVLSTSQSGPNFYIGNHAGADGTYAPLRPGRSDTSHERQDAIELAELATGKKLSPSEVSSYWFGRAWEFIRGQPVAWLALMARKAALLVNWYEVPDAENQYFYEEYSPVLRASSCVWHFGILVPAAVLGVVLGHRNRKEISLPLLIGATLSIAVVFFFVFGRYRFTLAPALMLLAGVGVVDGWRLLSAKEWRAMTAPLLAGLVAAVAANWPIYARDHHLAESYSNAGAAASDAGNHAQGIMLLRKALDLKPNLPDTVYNLAMSVGRAGQVADAIPLLRDAIRLRPDDARFEMMLGTALAETGQEDEAISHLRNAVRLGPQDVDSRTNYRMLLERKGRWREAIEQSKALVGLIPNDAGALAEHSRLLATCPDESLRDIVGAAQSAEQAQKLAAAAGDAQMLKQLDELIQRIRDGAPAP